MRRRNFIVLLGGAAAAWPLAARAQQPYKNLRLGSTLINPRNAPFWMAFDQRLRDLGYIEGQNLSLEFIETAGQPDRIVEAMRELVRRRVDILVAGGPEVVLRAAVAATKTLPIVMIAVDYDPIALGYADSLARPKANVTGVYFQQIELAVKRMELTKQAFPNAERGTAFWDQLSFDQWQAMERSQDKFGLRLTGVELGQQPYDYELALQQSPPESRDVLIVMASPIFYRDRDRLATFAIRHRLPTIFPFREWVEAGGLLSYGPSLSGLYSRAAEYVDRLARGATPSELPIEQPTKFDLVLNLKTARAIGANVSTSMLVRADEVIE